MDIATPPQEMPSGWDEAIGQRWNEQGDESVTVPTREGIDRQLGAAEPAFDGGAIGATVGGSDGIVRPRPDGFIVSALVLSTAAVLMGLVTFVVGHWVGATSDSPQPVDTADCKVIAISVPIEPSNCRESAEASIVGARDPDRTGVASLSLSASRSSQVFVPAPGLWIHSILQSLG